MSLGIVLLAIAAVTIVVSIWMTSERPAKHAVQQEPTACETEWPCGDDEPHSPSADFAALINAIARQGAANRSEEKREDNGKKLRDWITIALLIATTGGIYWQIHEMIKVYGPIKRQADAAASQIAITSGQLGVMKQEGRAWIGPTAFTFADPSSADEPLKILVDYLNYGREPAKDVRHASAVSLFLFSPVHLYIVCVRCRGGKIRPFSSPINSVPLHISLDTILFIQVKLVTGMKPGLHARHK